jgi:ribosomal protein L31E
MYKQAPKSPAMKALVGNQKNLPAGLKAQIEAAPESPAKNMNKGYGSPAKKGKPTKKANFDGYESIGESDTEKGAHRIRGKSVKSNTAATDHRMSKTAEGKYKVYKSVSPAKMDIGPEKPKSSAPAIKKANKTHSFVKTKTKERIKEEKINLPAKAKKLTSKSPAKSPAKKFVIVTKKKEDGTLNPEYLKGEQYDKNSQARKKSHNTNFGVKKPKANIK